MSLRFRQDGREGDLQLQQENDPVKQYEFSKSISIAALDLVLQLEAYKTSLTCKKGRFISGYE